MTQYYSLPQVLRVASKHPFYNSQARYPPSIDQVNQIACDDSITHTNLDKFPLLQKPHLYEVISRLLSEENAANDFRKDSYISTTGGGSGSTPMIFLTDNKENRKQRSLMGQLIRDTKIIEPGDWAVTIHTAGNMYRALDLTSENLENAGASVISAGHQVSPSRVFEYLKGYKANVLSGDSSQILLFARYAESLDPAIRSTIFINKIIYTSEPLILSQRRYLRAVFGPVQIYSFLASAEAGPWTVANLSLTGDPDADYADFIYDTRSMIVEIIRDQAHVNNPVGQDDPVAGETGRVVLTSLMRLRNPLIRYDTGDLGSVHELPPQAKAQLAPEIAPFLKIFRIHGRDQMTSFSYMGEYFDLANLADLFNNVEFPVLKWQVILIPASAEHIDELEIRLLSGAGHQDLLVQTLRKFFWWESSYERYFHINFLNDTSEFIRSSTGNKVIRFIRQERITKQ